MFNLTNVFKRLLKLDSVDENEVKDFQDLAETFQSNKYTNTNSNPNALEKLLAAANLEDPTEAGPILEPNLEWDPKQTKNNKDKILESTMVPATSNSSPEAVVRTPATKSSDPLYDTFKGPKYKDLLSTQLELMRLLSDEYNNVMPAPRNNTQTNKFGKEEGANFVLRGYDIPHWIMTALETNSIGRLDLKTEMNEKNYVNRFQNLLWLEEAHQAIAMRRYDMSGIILAKYDSNSFILKVPGLAEGRPSLMRGDTALLKSAHRNTYYEGYICEVRENDVIIRTHDSLHSGSRSEGLVFDVHFVSSRTPFRRCHHGITNFKHDPNIQNVVFPIIRISQLPALVEFQESPEDLRCFMRDLNIHQRNAVINIVKNKCRPAPYILFGPPGTGKTVTFVEAIFQIYARMPNSKILVCANSNASADLIAKRVYERKLIKDSHLVRLSAFYRFDQDIIPDDVKPITKEMNMISCSSYKSYRVVITTCIQSGCLYEFKDRYDYVFIDEAGHANEAESMISLGLIKRSGACALAGDPHQLGPVCISDVAKKYGLGLSLLERIFTRGCYARKDQDGRICDYNPDYITKLITSYRCDARIMVINNKNFYDNELLFVKKTPSKWLEVVKADNPLIFHSVKGRDRREYLNPSWFNANEAVKCMIYVNSLYKAGLKADQLGIITPYRRQIDKLKTLFDSLGLDKCKIATMEEFQGDEREVIIISAVRSNARNLEFDRNFNLGFLLDPKRFNVGISRAKWLVIVIGDRELLKRDKLWQEYMETAFNVHDDTGMVQNPSVRES